MSAHRCPICSNEVTERIQGAWPFCSKRCKMIDLGRWAKEDYRIAGAVHDPEAGAQEPRTAAEPPEDEW
ncbi:MAG: DNA gyrase inhibitor YacG [Bdellovibrionales bacterium]|nr:DNA gyrase inhibitor YacG [Bdellovibrionales bacterium]